MFHIFGILLYFLFICLLTVSSYRSTEHDHVKDNLHTKLLRIWTFGKIKLEEFKDLLSIAVYKMCESKMEKNPTWYPLTLDVFVKFSYKVILVFYHENIFSLFMLVSLSFFCMF